MLSKIIIPGKSWYCTGKNVDNCNNISHNISGGNKINFDLGVKTPEICTPEELMEVFNEG
jgi:hypothetical protein